MKQIVVLVVVLSLGLWMVPRSTPTAEVGENATFASKTFLISL